MNDITEQKTLPPLALSYLVSVANLRPDGLNVHITTTNQDRAAIANMLGLPSVEALEGNFTLLPGKRGLVMVTGIVTGNVYQTCVVTLEPFQVAIKEEVSLEFLPPANEALDKRKAQNPTKTAPAIAVKSVAPATDLRLASHDAEDLDPPDEIINGHIDLGSVTTEFLALGLDPFPRKPGAEFKYVDPADEKENPFAALSKLVPKP